MDGKPFITKSVYRDGARRFLFRFPGKACFFEELFTQGVGGLLRVRLTVIVRPLDAVNRSRYL